MTVIVDVNDKFICHLQQLALKAAQSYEYSVDCADPTFCDKIAALWASELAAANTDCDNAEKVTDYTDNVISKSVQSRVFTDPPDTVTTDCTMSFTDITPSTSCEAITFTEIL